MRHALYSMPPQTSLEIIAASVKVPRVQVGFDSNLGVYKSQQNKFKLPVSLRCKGDHCTAVATENYCASHCRPSSPSINQLCADQPTLFSLIRVPLRREHQDLRDTIGTVDPENKTASLDKCVHTMT